MIKLSILIISISILWIVWMYSSEAYPTYNPFLGVLLELVLLIIGLLNRRKLNNKEDS